MTIEEKALRLGVYVGLAAVKLGDDSYARQFLDRTMTDVGQGEYLEAVRAIHERLAAAGMIAPDQDPFEDLLKVLGLGAHSA